MYLQSRQALQVVKSSFPDIWNVVEEYMTEKEIKRSITTQQRKAKTNKITEHLEIKKVSLLSWWFVGGQLYFLFNLKCYFSQHTQAAKFYFIKPLATSTISIQYFSYQSTFLTDNQVLSIHGFSCKMICNFSNLIMQDILFIHLDSRTFETSG